MNAMKSLHGRIIDADSHEMIPASMWPEVFGDVGEKFANISVSRGKGMEAGLNTLTLDVDGDVLPIDEATVWRHEGWQAGPAAPGAIDMARRLELLDFMGVRRQQVFPSFGLIGLAFETMGPEFMRNLYRLDAAEYPLDDLRSLGRDVMRAHNDWAIRQIGLDADRLRVVGVVPVSDFDEMMQTTGALLDAGVRSVVLPASIPPGGFSPADRALEPFWSMCEEHDVTLLLHLALEDFTKTNRWREIPEFAPERGISAEFVIDPWTFSTLHMVAEIYLTTMILGGVFERHPRLRLGAIECGAFWVAPMAENLDRWSAQFSRRQAKVISMPPSEYVNRNVWATPFYFEPVDRYIERYGFEDVYLYGSDYPHFEGGKDQLSLFAGKLERLGDDVLEKFFVTNGERMTATKGP